MGIGDRLGEGRSVCSGPLGLYSERGELTRLKHAVPRLPPTQAGLCLLSAVEATRGQPVGEVSQRCLHSLPDAFDATEATGASVSCAKPVEAKCSPRWVGCRSLSYRSLVRAWLVALGTERGVRRCPPASRRRWPESSSRCEPGRPRGDQLPWATRPGRGMPQPPESSDVACG